MKSCGTIWWGEAVYIELSHDFACSYSFPLKRNIDFISKYHEQPAIMSKPITLYGHGNNTFSFHIASLTLPSHGPKSLESRHNPRRAQDPL